MGAMWECPFLVPLEGHSNARPPSGVPSKSVGPLLLKEDQLYMMCVSPYPHFLKDRLTNPCLYWLGHLQQELFMIEESNGTAVCHIVIDITYASTHQIHLRTCWSRILPVFVCGETN